MDDDAVPLALSSMLDPSSSSVTAQPEPLFKDLSKHLPVHKTMHPASAFLVCSFTSPLCRKFMKGVSKSPLNVLLGFVFLCIQLPSEGWKRRSLAHVRWCFLLNYSPEEALASFPACSETSSPGAELPAAWLHSELPLAVRHAWELLMAEC